MLKSLEYGESASGPRQRKNDVYNDSQGRGDQKRLEEAEEGDFTRCGELSCSGYVVMNFLIL